MCQENVIEIWARRQMVLDGIMGRAGGLRRGYCTVDTSPHSHFIIDNTEDESGLS
ncbi:hypothetical protein CC1G_15107 [Coprinopsis cinerea okayama7|uniref:Uncharacterized protein n=1 Tax=Coprinopsis cinerea (strain Okayama-7 / 130 / ATCC MYA-4618 / FGSC 9003) TaxID=240176 RepID=D6RPG9_COPC7|nr:hypothetical protein CC1G_15107 [Coprinopsis cinerea okayama7\|eukprot:XP_002910466.1 hypothetical protein CC1G_15107 [Coprinopsis cinerea okayama7\